MTFADMLELPALACGTVDDGYNGARRAVIWRHDAASMKIIRQWSHGFHVDPLPLAATIADAVFLLENHPNARGYRLRRARPQRCPLCGEADRNAGRHGRGACVSVYYTGATFEAIDVDPADRDLPVPHPKYRRATS